MSDWQVYLMMTVIVGAMLLGKKMMFFDENKKNKDSKWLIQKLLITNFQVPLFKDGKTNLEWLNL